MQSWGKVMNEYILFYNIEYILLYNISVSVTFILCVYLHLAFLFVMLSENQVYDNVVIIHCVDKYS